MLQIAKTNFSGHGFLPLVLALVAFLFLARPALADSESVEDPPRVQQANGYKIEYLSPGNQGQHVGDKITFTVRVSDSAGKPASDLALNVTAIRNYSGQVKKEHNGPRTPDLGPFKLTPAANPGEYQANFTFPQNGHWFIKIDGLPLGASTVQFRQPVEAEANTSAGFNWDWLLWAGIVALVIGIVMVVRDGGEKFPVPTSELEPALVPAKGGK